VNIDSLIFETDRLIVKRFTENNKEEFYKVNGDAQVMKYIRPAKSRFETDAFLLEVIEYYNQTKIFGRWGVWNKSSNEFVGSFALIPVEKSEKMQLGYALLRESRGKGYASELTKAGIEYFFSNTEFTVFFAQTEAGNIPSINVLIKCGFNEWGRHREGNKEIIEYVVEKSSDRNYSKP